MLINFDSSIKDIKGHIIKCFKLDSMSLFPMVRVHLGFSLFPLELMVN